MFIPENVQWFIAVQVEEFQIEGESENLVYLNHILIKAISAEMAYTRAQEICGQSNHQYKNFEGNLVTCKFRGLYDLFPIHDELEDGKELSFINMDRLLEEEISKLVRSKDELDIFRPEVDEESK